MTVFVPVLDETTLKRVTQHEAIHRMGMCACPCMEAFLTLANSLPERDKAMKLEGLLAVISSPETENDE